MGRIAFAVFVSLALSGAGALAACPVASSKAHPAKTHAQANNCVNLSAVPQISAQVVAGEQAPAVVKAPAYADPSPARYEGPTLGLTKLDPSVRPAPTIGYHWNLE
jgi:hypothetical protein